MFLPRCLTKGQKWGRLTRDFPRKFDDYYSKSQNRTLPRLKSAIQPLRHSFSNVHFTTTIFNLEYPLELEHVVVQESSLDERSFINEPTVLNKI